MAKQEFTSESPQANPGYALGQVAKALTTAEEHDDEATRKRAEKKIAKCVLTGLVTQTIGLGSRTPVANVPAWATVEVVTGGFATGELLAGGDLLDHERELMSELSISADGRKRLALNSYFLTDAGCSRLRTTLASGRYEIGVPEEGALLAVVWLLDNGHADLARSILTEIAPFFATLRFYPKPLDQPRPSGPGVHLQDVASTIESLNQIAPNPRVLAQREAIEIWVPLYDRVIALFLETVNGEPPSLKRGDASPCEVEGGFPCQVYPDEWAARANALLDEYAAKRDVHNLCGKPDRKKENFPQLRMWMRRCIDGPTILGEKEIERIRLLLARSLNRRGLPTSSRCGEIRKRQVEQAGGPTHHEIAPVVVSRLRKYPRRGGVDDLAPLSQPVTKQESKKFALDATAEIPASMLRKVERCLIGTAEELIAKGIIKSGETLARVLPQATAGLRAAGLTDPTLRQLDAAIYRAFRRRRSLLLLNLENQVQVEELPWVAAIDEQREDSVSSRELARETLKEIVGLAVVSFPHAILPNKLLQELRSLARTADLDVPLVDEVAADIFMGEFSSKYLKAAKRTADFLKGSLYETYYDIDFQQIQELPEENIEGQRRGRRSSARGRSFVAICAQRAGVRNTGWDVAKNGMIIEQQQILTTQNLAVLFAGLNLRDDLDGRLDGLARRCFQRICRRQQANSPTWHALLIMFKNTAYAWRQMIFYLSLISADGVKEFLAWADDHLAQQSPDFQKRFQPAMAGLQAAADGDFPSVEKTARRFLGWTKRRHWLLGPKKKRAR